MIIMGIDHGDARTGISVCDKNEVLASPVTVISQWNQEKLTDEICKYINEYNPELIVVGLPKNMDGTLGESAVKCTEFAELLNKKCGIECVMRDERLTTVSAHNALNLTDTRGKKRKEVIDAVAATMILQEFIDSRKKG